MNKKKKGFTLIELLVVIAIIGLLSTLSVLALNSARARSRDAKRIADIKQIQTALEMYYNEHNTYPPTASVVSGQPFSSSSTVLIREVPTAPTPTDGSCDSNTNPYKYAFVAQASGQGTGAASYTLQYCLGAATGNVPAGIATATPAGIR